jgi:dolichol-phosphate mannosyltransferase
MAVQFSVIVPTYKERGNLSELVTRITKAMETAGHPRGAFEIIIVDDNSRDGSVEVVDELKQKGHPVRIEVRTKERGLSSAVIHGFNKAAGRLIMCMDADLQHPPEMVPALFASLDKTGVQFTIGTRYGEGVEVSKDWPVHRKIISWGARMLARPLMPIHSLSDPMTGFFALKRDVFEAAMAKGDVSGLGFKICLELFIKCRISKFSEVPFSFGTRLEGESKLSGKVMTQYLTHLDQLMWFRYGVGFFLFFFIVAVVLALLVARFVLRII